jgi:hypothetical protein
MLKFCNVSAISAFFSKGIFAAATNSTKKTNKAGGKAIDQSIFNVRLIDSTLALDLIWQWRH